MMFVVFSAQEDDCAARVYGELRARGRGVMMVDDARSTSELGLTWHMDAAEPYGGWIDVGEDRAELHAIEGILLRMIHPFRAEPGQVPHDRQYVLAEMSAAVEGMLNAFPGPVINRPVPGVSGRNLFTRRGAARLLRRCGFAIPDVVLSGRPEAMQSRFDALGYSRVLIAGLHAAVAPSTVETDRLGEAIDGLAVNQITPPVYVLGLPEGDSKQVFVIGDNAIAVDRESGKRMDAPEPMIESACELARVLGVQFVEVQVVQTPAGELVCLGMNEFPIYNHCPVDVQDAITSALADSLESPQGALT